MKEHGESFEKLPSDVKLRILLEGDKELGVRGLAGRLDRVERIVWGLVALHVLGVGGSVAILADPTLSGNAFVSLLVRLFA